MAQRALSPDAFTCPICLHILKDPGTLPCGHSYCRDCIQTHWDQEVRPSCPQCRQTFTPRPVLSKSTVLVNLLEELKVAGLIAPPADHCYAAPGDVSCDVCSGRKLKAVSSCLQCLVSYCETHLQPHHDVAVLQIHQLVAPSDKLCSEHNEPTKLFCRTDQQLICSQCSVDQHKGHDTVSSAAERTVRQKQLEAKRAVQQQQLQLLETEQKKLRQEAQDISHSAHSAVQHSGDSLREMALLLEKKIRSEEQIQLKQVQELQEQLQRDIAELKRSIFELDSLSLTADQNQFILLCPSLSTDSEQTESRPQTRPRGDFESVSRAVSALMEQLQLTLRDFNLFEPGPSSRKDFLRYACDVTLDPNTAHQALSLSFGNRQVSPVREKQNYPYHPDRFVTHVQVLSSEGLTGRCYWEVEVKYYLDIAVSYRDDRVGVTECSFGCNDKSWALRCGKKGYSFGFNDVWSEISGPVSPSIGVYLDHSAGALSFYCVQDKTMSLLHRVQTSFTQPLFVGVRISALGNSAYFMKLK